MCLTDINFSNKYYLKYFQNIGLHSLFYSLYGHGDRIPNDQIPMDLNPNNWNQGTESQLPAKMTESVY
jgi:hypothetical protein